MRRLNTLIAVAFALAVACQFPLCQKGPLVVSPNSARPGEMIHLHQDRGDFQSYGSLRVRIGDKPAHVSRISDTDLDVAVPMQPPASVRISLQDGTDLIASTRFSVLDTNCRRYVMQMDPNGVTLLRVEPCSDSVNGNVATLESRLSFDLVDVAGRVLHTASIRHPLETPAEVFSRSGNAGTIRATEPPKPAVFWVRFPNRPDAQFVRVYRVEPGLDLADSLDIQQRTLIDSLKVDIQ